MKSVKMFAVYHKKELYYISKTKKHCKMKALDFALDLEDGADNLEIIPVLISPLKKKAKKECV